MRSASLVVRLSLILTGAGSGFGCGQILDRAAGPVIRQISAEDAQRRVEDGAVILLQVRPLGPGEKLVHEAQPVFGLDTEELTWAETQELIVVGSDEGSWRLAASLVRERGRTVGLAPSGPEHWPGPRTARQRQSEPGI